MSVGVSLILESLGHSPDRMLEGYPEYGLLRVMAADLRSLKRGDGTPCPQGIMMSPTPDEPWHAVVFDLSGKRTSAGNAAIAKVAAWEVPLVG